MKNSRVKDLLNRYRGTKIDGLDYVYGNNEKSNQLLSVTDAGTTAGYLAAGGSYLYDANGNLTTDPSKGTIIEYNPLNLPERVTFDLDDEIRYTYDAAGNKRIKVVVGRNAENNTRIDYSGNFLYENNDLKAIFTSVGRIVPFNNNGEVLYKFEYNLQDHLGNTRVVFGGHSNGKPEVMQVTDYYPFGLVMNQENYFADGVLSNKYLYNGKELQDDELAGNSLGWCDYGARMYAPDIACFATQDPMAEDYYDLSPYGYVAGNPIAARDENGEWINFVVGAVVGAATDYAIQVAVNIAENGGEINMDAFTKVDGGSIAVSAGTGALGVGVATNVTKAVKAVKTVQKVAYASKTGSKVINGVANITGDAAASFVGSAVKGEEISVNSIGSDVIGGAAGRGISNKMKSAAQNTSAAKMLHRQADRAQRVANGSSRQSRIDNAQKATQKANNYGATKAITAGAAGSNATSKIIQAGTNLIDDENK